MERLLREGSSAEEPINIQLSDYSSDEGSSTSSDNEGRDFAKDFSDLEGPCCQPLRVPPCSPELDVQIRKLRYSRMRKIMQQLDRIYFKPIFRKRILQLLKLKSSLTSKRLNRKSIFKTTKVDGEINAITLQYVENSLNYNSQNNATSGVKILRPQKHEMRKKHKHSKRQQNLHKRPITKVSRKLRLWLNKRQIFILRRKMHHKFKSLHRLKSLHRRKRGERLLLDMPTTDPGSDLFFSTDEEYIDANGIITCYSTMPTRIRRHLLKSELQRHYLEEIGDGLKNMPPELIITSPSNKTKHKNHSLRILYKAAAVEKNERKYQTTNVLPFIGQLPKRTRSWHNLNSAGRPPSLSPYKSTTATKNNSPNAFYRPLSKKEILSKEDLDIKLSLKKKIWTGVQPDDISLDIDRTKALSWVTPHTLKSKRLTGAHNFTSELNLDKLSNSNNLKNMENESFLTACSRKLIEWQMMKTNLETSPVTHKKLVPLKLVVPDIDDNRTIYIFKDVANAKSPCTSLISQKSDNDISSDTKQERSANITKLVKTGKIFTKFAKSKARNNISATQRDASNQNFNQHKSHVRYNKFKTGSLVVTAVQSGNNCAIGGVKKNKKLKSLHHKLPNINSSTPNNPNCGESRRSSSYSNKNNNNKASLAIAASATAIVRKVKTKLKKKKLHINAKTETTIN